MALTNSTKCWNLGISKIPPKTGAPKYKKKLRYSDIFQYIKLFSIERGNLEISNVGFNLLNLLSTSFNWLCVKFRSKPQT